MLTTRRQPRKACTADGVILNRTKLLLSRFRVVVVAQPSGQSGCRGVAEGSRRCRRCPARQPAYCLW